MAEITAALVKKLRERSGLPMMECKRALTETNGDEEKAMDLLRKQGAAAAEKKAGRETSEGRIGSYVDKEKASAGLVEILCETAPTASNPELRTFADMIAKHVALAGDANAATIESEVFVDDRGKAVKDVLHDIVNRIRENIKIGRVVRLQGRSAVYIHHTGKIGVGITVEGDGNDDALLNDICMHIAAMQPQAVTRDGMPADAVAKEEEIAREQIQQSGKPDHLVDKILTGKMNRWFSEHVLLEQPFVKDDKQTVGKVAEQAGFKVTGFARVQVGAE